MDTKWWCIPWKHWKNWWPWKASNSRSCKFFFYIWQPFARRWLIHLSIYLSFYPKRSHNSHQVRIVNTSWNCYIHSMRRFIFFAFMLFDSIKLWKNLNGDCNARWCLFSVHSASLSINFFFPISSEKEQTIRDFSFIFSSNIYISYV